MTEEKHDSRAVLDFTSAQNAPTEPGNTQEELGIASRLGAIAERFLEIAESSSNPRTVSGAMKVIRESIELAEKLTKPDSRDINPRHFAEGFLSYIEHAYRRSDVWRAYVAYCAKNEFRMLSKSVFFDILLISRFEIVLRNKEYLVIPPKKPHPNVGESALLVESFPPPDFSPYDVYAHIKKCRTRIY